MSWTLSRPRNILWPCGTEGIAALAIDVRSLAAAPIGDGVNAAVSGLVMHC